MKKDIIYPWETEAFLNIWRQYKAYRKEQHKFKFKSPRSEQAALKRLARISEGHEDVAISAIETSIANGWKGIFIGQDEKELIKKHQNNGKQLSWRD